MRDTKTKPSGPKQVADSFANLDHPLKAGMESVRESILGADKGITEHIKWNAPSFCHGGDDRVTFNLHKSGDLLLIFHRGAKVKIPKGNGRLIDDPTGLLEWITDNHTTLRLSSLQEIDDKKAALKKIVKLWIAAAAG